MNLAIGSIAKLKSNGDRGHPCLVPFWRMKDSDNCLLVFTRAIGSSYRARIRETKLSLKPILLRTWKSQSRSMLLNAFSASKVIRLSRSGWCLACSRTVNTFLMFVIPERHLTKPCWESFIRSGNIPASLLAIIFDSSFASTLINEMGLYDAGSNSSLPPFGNTFYVSFFPWSKVRRTPPHCIVQIQYGLEQLVLHGFIIFWSKADRAWGFCVRLSCNSLFYFLSCNLGI